MNSTVDPTTSLDNGTITGDPTTTETATGQTTSAGKLQPAWLVIVIPFIIIIGLAIIGVVFYLWSRQRRKRINRDSRHSYPGAHERGQGRTGSTIDLPTSAAPMGEGLNELGEAPPPYPPPEDDTPKENTTVQVLQMQGAAGESSGESSSSSSSSDQHGGPSTTSPEMEEARNSNPPAYDAVMSQRVVSLLTPPTAVAGVTVAAGHA